jgi:phage protein, HK97 gp10 family
MMDGVDELLRRLEDVSGIAPELYRLMDQCGTFIRDDARLRVPVDIGDLRKSIQNTIREIEGGIETIVHTNSDHAAFVEFGTGPVGAANHQGISPLAQPVYAREKWRGVIPFLKNGKDSGIRFIAGQPAQPYLYPALKENEQQLEQFLVDGIREAIRRKTDG